MTKGKQKMAAGQGSELDARLNNYSAVARVSAAAQKLHSRTGNWPIYAAAAGSALAMATSASASIISNNLDGVSVEAGGNLSSKFSIKGLILLGEVNLRANSGISAAGPFATLAMSGANPASIFATATAHQNVLNFGKYAKISHATSAVRPSAVVEAFFSGKSFGSFVSGQPGYAGLAFGAPGGGYNYGWLKLEFVTDSLTHKQELLALAYGVETTVNQSIEAGDTPEPGTTSLMLLAAGAAGVLALRRRRKQKSAPAAV